VNKEINAIKLTIADVKALKRQLTKNMIQQLLKYLFRRLKIAYKPPLLD